MFVQLSKSARTPPGGSLIIRPGTLLGHLLVGERCCLTVSPPDDDDDDNDGESEESFQHSLSETETAAEGEEEEKGDGNP